MAFRRGFKSQCERRAVELRKQLGLGPRAPLLADDLAAHLRVVVWSTNDVDGVPIEVLNTLNDTNDDSWSALTVRIGTANLVVHKEVPSEGWRNSIVMHELSHILLGHELADACVLEDGSLVPRNFDQDQEDEADWLGGTLLLPRPAVLSIKSSGLSDSEACKRYLVTESMLNWRTRMTGVNQQLAYAGRR